jgi:hypothetical protein
LLKVAAGSFAIIREDKVAAGTGSAARLAAAAADPATAAAAASVEQYPLTVYISWQHRFLETKIQNRLTIHAEKKIQMETFNTRAARNDSSRVLLVF